MRGAGTRVDTAYITTIITYLLTFFCTTLRYKHQRPWILFDAECSNVYGMYRTLGWLTPPPLHPAVSHMRTSYLPPHYLPRAAARS